MAVESFTINVPQAVLDDLKRRLARTQWPDEVEGAGWDYGANLDYLRELADYWQNQYDWRAEEAKLNQFAQFCAKVDGIGIHFIHERGKGPNPMPLLLTHGWPDSFHRFYKVIPLLTDPVSYGGDPADAFDVIVPSIPGHGFSDRVHTRGLTSERIADLWARLMTKTLGYKKYAAAGGDAGSEVTLYLGQYHSKPLIGIHLLDVSYPQAPPDGVKPSEAGKKYLEALQKWIMSVGVFYSLQSTKPQSVAYALNDSPIGLAAWIVEKFRSWSDCNGNVERRFSKDELLTNIMIYWVTQTISSSIRRYYENMHGSTPLYPGPHIEVPVAVADFQSLLPPRDWVEHAMNLQRWTKMPRGGHFASLEEPELFAEDIRAFFRSLR
jgi:microsomal epoxide hydrolase